MMRPVAAATANNFLINLGPGLSLRATSADTSVGDGVQQIDLALISSKHKIGRIRIIRILLGCAACSGNGSIDNREVAFVLNLQRWPHRFLVCFDSRI